MDMSVKIGSMTMKNPVTVASGTFGYGMEFSELIDVSKLGAITVKGIKLEPCIGNPLPRFCEVPGGMINAIGLQGPGVDNFIKDDMPFLRTKNTPVIVNIWGTDIDEYAETAARLSKVEGISALELNVSCPNVKKGGSSFSANPKLMGEVVKAVRTHTNLPVITKLAPNVPDITVYAKEAVEQGSDALSVCNTVPAMAIDINTRKHVIANKTGGLSGSAIHHIAVKLVWETSHAVSVPIIGMGGIMEPQDAIELMCAGASAVAVGTANFIDPTTSIRVIDGIREYMEKNRFSSISEIPIK